MLTNIFSDTGITITNVGYSTNEYWEAETSINDRDILIAVSRKIIVWNWYIYEWCVDEDEARYEWVLLNSGPCKDRTDGQRLCLEALQAMRSAP